MYNGPRLKLLPIFGPRTAVGMYRSILWYDAMRTGMLYASSSLRCWALFFSKPLRHSPRRVPEIALTLSHPFVGNAAVEKPIDGDSLPSADLDQFAVRIKSVIRTTTVL